ncbi:MAG: hypothetical protein HC913_09970 [Microscillaceae bacterium]|nr:hypothetical protein [Microscillaceae bacterium]
MEVKEDTTTYEVAAFSDGTERKIEEIIKKLPGVDVNPKTGQIKYKGKAVETVMLDGVNLFDYSYTIGTRNINVRMVEQIEAIDNYSENQLLKGIEAGGKVALNLKLKKGKFDFSGNVDAGSGLTNEPAPLFNLNSTLLGITSALKSFYTLSFNNFGANLSPFDYYSEGTSIEDDREEEFYAKKVIPQSINTVIDPERSVFNRSWFGNANIAFKPSKNISLKTNLYYYQDVLEAEQLSAFDNIIGNQTLSTSDRQTQTKEPALYRGDVELKWNTSPTALLEYEGRIFREIISFPATVLVNQQNTLQSIAQSEAFFQKQKLVFTKKLSARQAIQGFFTHSQHQIQQDLSISPSALDLSRFEQDRQSVDNQKTIWAGESTFLGANKRDRYVFTLGIQNKHLALESRLQSRETNTDTLVSEAENDFDYQISSLYNTASYLFSRGRWQLTPAYNLRLFRQDLREISTDSAQHQTDFFLEPALAIRYKLGQNASVGLNTSYTRLANAENYSFRQPILLNNRNLVNNTPRLLLQNLFSSDLSYKYADLYNQFYSQAGLSFQYSEGGFLSNLTIGPNLTQTNFFFLPQNQTNTSLFLSAEKLVSFLSANMELDLNYSIAQYNNVLNDSELRTNRANTFSSDFSVRTAFDIPVNFNNAFSFLTSQSRSKEGESFRFSSLTNTFELLFSAIKNVPITVSAAYFVPNLSNGRQSLLFLDVQLLFLPPKAKFELEAVFRNLLNTDNFIQLEVNDFSTSVFQTSLLPRYFLINASFSF